MQTERRALNEDVFRRVNERLKELAESLRFVDPSPPEFVCECGRETCVEPIELTLSEYERVRARATWFVLKPGHENPTRERVVERTDRFLIVEKLGEAATIAKSLDPRQS